MRTKTMRFPALLAAWTAQEVAILSGAIGALIGVAWKTIHSYLVYRDRTVRERRLLIEQSTAETDLSQTVLAAAVDSQSSLHITREATGADRMLLFRTHNGDGIPKPTQPIKSTATLETYKPDLDPILPDWTAEVAGTAFLELLIAATERKGETILVVADKLPEGPLKDRLVDGKTPFAIVAYVTEVEHFPTYVIAFYRSLAKANSPRTRIAVQGVASRFRANQLKIAEKQTRVQALDNQLTKSMEQA